MDTRGLLQLAIETPTPGVRVVRVAGPLGPPGAARLIRLIDAQLHLARTGQVPVEHLVLDLEGVTDYDPDAVGALRSVEHACGEAHIGLHLAGFSGRLVLLPIRVRQLLLRFSAFPAVEVAVASLGRRRAAEHPGGP